MIKFFSIIAFLTGSLSASPFEGERKFLKKLGAFERRLESDDPLPHLIVSSAQAYKVSQAAILKALKEILRSGKSELRSLRKASDLKLPELSITGTELEGIQKCNLSYCAVKLLNVSEKKRLETAPDKGAMFRQFLFERISAYIRSGELVGSEENISNRETMRIGFSQLGFFPSLYPKTYAILSEGIFRKTSNERAKPLSESFMTLETIYLESDRLKPVLRVSAVFEFEEAESNIFIDLHLYSNHFFDSSLRVIEVQKHSYEGMPSRIILTDVVELDELKKSGLIRALFKGKMISGIHFYQSTLLEKVKQKISDLK